MMMMMMIMIMIVEIYELNMTVRRGRTSHCCRCIQSHEGEFIDEQETKKVRKRKQRGLANGGTRN